MGVIPLAVLDTVVSGDGLEVAARGRCSDHRVFYNVVK
jgi:hypothetical protein